ncbi:glycosyltransferase [Streptomyces sp. BE20]|uniref:glycosyltransferase n=1 Tax=Streptomyces sp. BE20 TaxID=3002525 RepID=UPI002E7A38E1|nr:glycosyltransferase [Streptomyces sp. BE20]MEE1825366.1 glycosyltransferase [Streptomyces sp. BE20]
MAPATPVPNVDTTLFTPTRMRSTERAALLQRLLAVDPFDPAPGNRGITSEGVDLARLRMQTLHLGPLVVAVLGPGRDERLPLLFDAISTAGRTLEPRVQPVLVVCGSPRSGSDDADRLLSLVMTTGLRESVLLAGQVPHGELPSLFAAADAYVSAARHTTASLWEAMACATPPILLSDADVEQVIVQGGYDANGWVSDPCSEGLAAALVQVCLDPAERLRRGTAAAARARAQGTSS